MYLETTALYLGFQMLALLGYIFHVTECTLLLVFLMNYFIQFHVSNTILTQWQLFGMVGIIQENKVNFYSGFILHSHLESNLLKTPTS